MERIRWSERIIPFRSLVDNPSIHKPALVQIGNKAIVVGEKINGEFILASPCKVSGDRFDVMEQEIVLSSKHTGVWRVISKATSKKEGHIHRLTTKDLERIHRQDVANERTTPRSYICIRDIEAFELHVRSDDPTVANGNRIERRIKQIEEDVEFEIDDTGEVEYTPSEGERTSQDYVMVPKRKQPTILQLLLPGVIDEEQLVRNRVVRALHCTTKGGTRRRHFLLEVSEQPCEIRPIASEGSTELRYLHSTQNLYDYMLTYGNDTILYVKLLRGDPPIKAIEFDSYMVLKNTLNGDKIPICRVEDLEVTLISPDFPLKVRMPTKSEHVWRSLSEVRAAEVQCMQLALALLARHESEMYVSIEAEKNTPNHVHPSYNQVERSHRSSRPSSDAMKKHIEECEKVFGTNNQNQNQIRTKSTTDNNNFDSSLSADRHVSLTKKNSHRNQSTQHHGPIDEPPIRTHSHSSHPASDKLYRTFDKRSNDSERTEQTDSYNHSHRPTIRKPSFPPPSSHHHHHNKTKI
ncbi:unnamed protein product [Adineta steineri]|uniref:CABIT domain-containing protein n=1 Tax=Adineta steineri TaxID=433720 RepID=A0A815RAW9_9BILA|nr:unnamed protein product [Adineta steineri]CAF1474106.1 unnamed protein product [Adineta steineri]CAF3523930.1 unnamed protein product [Adineta steineri]CAF3898856.1 unnamed protein product [Adineta steineri]